MNTPDDMDAYFSQQHDRIAELQHKLREDFPELTSAAALADPPRLVICCPRGHRIRSVTLGSDHNWNLYLAPVDADRLERGRQVAFRADPTTSLNHVSVAPCWEPGCSTSVTGHPYCPEHDQPGAGHDEFEGVRTRLTCPKKKCTYAGVHTQVGLLKLYAVAVRLDLPEIHLPF